MDCPACTAPNLFPLNSTSLKCDYCDSTWQLDANRCPSCQNPNPSTVEVCQTCGEPLSLFSQVIIRHGGGSRDPFRLQQARSRAADLKAQGEESSRARMQALQAIDRRREQHTAQEQLARATEEQKLIRLMAVVLIVAVVIVVALTAWQILR